MTILEKSSPCKSKGKRRKRHSFSVIVDREKKIEILNHVARTYLSDTRKEIKLNFGIPLWECCHCKGIVESM